MRKRLVPLLGMTAGLAVASGLPGPAAATVIDTFTFAFEGTYINGNLTGGEIAGSFTGTVEPDGTIGLADILSFNAHYLVGNFGFVSTATNFFAFLAEGPGGPDAGTLDFSAPVTGGEIGEICVGAVAAFGVAGCASGLPAGANASAFLGPFVAYSVGTPFIRLDSRVVIPPPPPATVPEPGGPLLFGLSVLGLAVVGGAGQFRLRSGAAA